MNIKSKESILTKVLHYIDTNKEVNLFLSGGSSLELFDYLHENIDWDDLKRINIFQVDERFGEVYHEDSNMQDLASRDLSAFKSVNYILEGEELEESTVNYSEKLAGILNDGNNIALLGIGNDSHIAGIKSSLFNDITKLDIDKSAVIGYVAKDYPRITLTFCALKLMSYVVVFTKGTVKADMLKLLDKKNTLEDSPMHIINELGNVDIVNEKD